MKKVAIVGSRNYPNLDLVDAYVRALDPECVIVSGGAQGVDLTAEHAAESVGIKTIIHLPDWSQGKGAGFIRNSLIVADADIIVCFWDGISRGCIDTVLKAKKAGKPYEIYGPSGERLR